MMATRRMAAALPAVLPTVCLADSFCLVCFGVCRVLTTSQSSQGRIARKRLTPGETGLDSNAGRESVAKREARTAYVEHHAVASVNYAYACAFTHAQCPKATRLVRGATNIHHGGLASGLTRGKGTRSCGDTSRRWLNRRQRNRARFS